MTHMNHFIFMWYDPPVSLDTSSPIFFSHDIKNHALWGGCEQMMSSCLILHNNLYEVGTLNITNLNRSKICNQYVWSHTTHSRHINGTDSFTFLS